MSRKSLVILAVVCLFATSSHSATATTAAQEVARNIANQPTQLRESKEIIPSQTEEIVVDESGHEIDTDKDTANKKKKPHKVETITEYISPLPPPPKPKPVKKAVKPAAKPKPLPPLVSTRKAPPFFNAYPAFSVRVNFGFGKVNWKSVAPLITKNGDGGFAWGITVAQRFTRHIGVAVGTTHLPRVVGPPDIHQADITRFNSWASYGAVKIYAPVDPLGNLYVKLGVGYRTLTMTNTAQVASDGGVQDQTKSVGQVVPMFGAGGEYMLGNHYIVAVEYLYFQGQGRTPFSGGLSLPIPSANIFTLGFGFVFS